MAEEPKVVIEKSGNSALVAILAIIVLALVAAGAYALIESRNNKDNAIAGAADKVGDAAQDVGDAAQDAARGAR